MHPELYIPSSLRSLFSARRHPFVSAFHPRTQRCTRAPSTQMMEMVMRPTVLPSLSFFTVIGVVTSARHFPAAALGLIKPGCPIIFRRV